MSISARDLKGNQKLECQVCRLNARPSRYFHNLTMHLKTHGPSWTVERYKADFPGHPIISEYTRRRLSEGLKGRKRVNRWVKEFRENGAPAPSPSPTELSDPNLLAFGVARLSIRNGMGEADKALIPPHDENFHLDDNVLEAAALAVQRRENILAVGPTGCGKSTFFLELAAILSQPVRRVNLHGDVRAADFVGEKVVDVDPGTNQAVVAWRDGILPDAMRKGHWLLVDELDAAPPHILFVLQAVLEDGRKLVLSANHGEVVEAHPDFRIIATANTLGRGDDSGLYTGTHVLNEAFLDRFGTVIKWSYPSASKEAQIIIDKTGISADVAARMVQCAGLVRSGKNNEECFCTFSTRRLLKWAQKTVDLRGNHKKAAHLTILNKLNEDDHNFVKSVLQRVMGD